MCTVELKKLEDRATKMSKDHEQDLHKSKLKRLGYLGLERTHLKEGKGVIKVFQIRSSKKMMKTEQTTASSSYERAKQCQKTPKRWLSKPKIPPSD